MKLQDLLNVWKKLERGTEYPVSDKKCSYCPSTNMVLVKRKNSFSDWPYLDCKSCGNSTQDL